MQQLNIASVTITVKPDVTRPNREEGQPDGNVDTEKLKNDGEKGKLKPSDKKDGSEQC